MKHEHIGGQAVIEGVMMRSESKYAVCARVRKKIKTKKGGIKKRKKIFKSPFLRGVFMLIDMLVLGIKTLMWSADQQLDKHEKIKKSEIVFTLLISFGFAVLFFIIIPFFLAGLITKARGILFNLIDGVIRIGVFIAYILVISLMKDIRTIFQYHGAEHKAVNCYESGKELNIKNAKKFTTLNPRCGTSFIFIVLIISILVFSLIVSDSWIIRLGARILLIPVIAAVSYEFLKLGAKFQNKLFFRILNAPGLLLQKMTTKEPSNKQIEVAIKALKAVK